MTAHNEHGGSIPPSASRLGAAARRGRFPRSRLLLTGLSLFAGSAAVALFGRRVAGWVTTAVHGSLTVVERDAPAAGMLPAFRLAAMAIVLMLALPAATSLLGSLVIALRARRARGSSAVPLPPEHPGEHSPLAPRLAALGLMPILMLWVLGRHRELPAAWMAGDPLAAGEVARAAAELLAAAGLACALAGMAELALIRARLWSALSMTRSEARREQRAGSGRRSRVITGDAPQTTGRP